MKRPTLTAAERDLIVMLCDFATEHHRHRQEWSVVTFQGWEAEDFERAAMIRRKLERPDDDERPGFTRPFHR